MPPEIGAHWSAAEEARLRKDYAVAEREYLAVIAQAPRFAEAYMDLGLVYQLQENWREAMQTFRKALQLKPNLAGADFFLGVDYCKQGEGDRAIPYLKVAARQNPDIPEAWSWLATAQEMAGRISEETQTLEQGLRAHPGDVDLLYLLGHAYERLGTEAMDEIQKTDPGSSYVEKLLAESYARSSHWSAALIHLQDALAKAPQQPGLHVELGEVFLHAGNVKRAGEEFDAELYLNPRSLRALVRAGEIKLLAGDVARALQDWSRAIASDERRVQEILGIREFGFGESSQEQLPAFTSQQLSGLRCHLEAQSGPAARLALAFLAQQEGDSSAVTAAADVHADLERNQPQSCASIEVQRWLREDQLEAAARCGTRVLSRQSPTNLRFQMTEALFETDKPDQAIKVLEGLPTTQPALPEALYWRTRCYKKLALAAYLQLYQAAPESYRAHQLRGSVYAAREEDAKAIEEYRYALAQRPSLPNLHYEVGHLLWKRFKVVEAREELQAELRLNPRHPGALLDMGTTYLYEHQPEKALEYLRKVGNLDPNNTDIHQFLGMAYSQMGKYAQAELELKLAAPGDRSGKVHYELGRVYQALERQKDASSEFAVSAALNQESHRKNEERVQRLAAADAVLKQP